MLSAKALKHKHRPQQADETIKLIVAAVENKRSSKGDPPKVEAVISLRIRKYRPELSRPSQFNPFTDIICGILTCKTEYWDLDTGVYSRGGTHE